MKKIFAVFAVSLVLVAAPARASSFLINDSFESGDFTGWVTQDLAGPFFPLLVVPAGVISWPFFGWTSSPTDGAFTAFSGFDGSGPGTIFLAQDVAVPLNAGTISFDWRVGYDLTFGATQNRLFEFQVQPSGGGAALLTVNLLTAFANTVLNDTGNMTSLVDISLFAGQNLRFAWVMTIPQNFTGPAQLQLDNINTQPIPEPATLLLLGTGLGAVAARRRLKKRA